VISLPPPPVAGRPPSGAVRRRRVGGAAGWSLLPHHPSRTGPAVAGGERRVTRRRGVSGGTPGTPRACSSSSATAWGACRASCCPSPWPRCWCCSSASS